MEILQKVVFFNSIWQEVYPILSWIFIKEEPKQADETELAIIFYSMAIELCKKIGKIYAANVDPRFLEHTFVSYEEGVNFTSESLYFFRV